MPISLEEATNIVNEQLMRQTIESRAEGKTLVVGKHYVPNQARTIMYSAELLEEAGYKIIKDN